MNIDAIFGILLVLGFIQLTVVIGGKILDALAPKADPLKLINNDRAARGLPPLKQLP